MSILDVYRVDNHAPACTLPYRVKVDGKLLRDDAGEVRKFANLWAALYAAPDGTIRRKKTRCMAAQLSR